MEREIPCQVWIEGNVIRNHKERGGNVKEKPPIIHAEGCSTNLGIIGAECNCGAEVQLDADVEWYEEKLKCDFISVPDVVIKTRQKTAREIFEEIETRAELLACKIGDAPISLTIAWSDWRELKAKYLGVT